MPSLCSHRLRNRISRYISLQTLMPLFFPPTLHVLNDKTVLSNKYKRNKQIKRVKSYLSLKNY